MSKNILDKIITTKKDRINLEEKFYAPIEKLKEDIEESEKKKYFIILKKKY